MRKFIALLCLAVLAIVPGIAFADSAWGLDLNFDKTNEVNITSTGGFTTDGEITASKFRSSAGILMVHETFMDVPLVTTSTIFAVAVATASLASGYAIVPSNISQSTYPTNVAVGFDFGYATATFGATSNFKIYGRDSLGTLRTETITCAATAIMYYSSYAYIDILSSTVTLVGADVNIGGGGYTYNGVGIVNMGQGMKLGLCNRVGTATNALKFREGPVTVPAATGQAAINTTYNTWDPATDFNAALDFDIWYLPQSQK